MTKQMTKAVAKKDAQRDAMSDMSKTVKLIGENFTSFVYLYTDVIGRPCAKGFTPRALKPSISYYYKSEESRAKCVAEWMEALAERKAAKKAEKIERLLAVGDVLRASWGYDQTNIDYYMVTELVGKQSVKIVEIGQMSEQGEISMTGTCCPDVTKIIGESMTKRVSLGGDSVRLNSFSWARLEKPEIVAGAKVYKKSNWTAYA